MTWAGDFQVEQPDSGSHIVRITPQSHFAQGNVSMRLIGLNPPVIFTLKAERKTVHVRLDVQIPEVWPKGILPPVMTPVSIKAGDDAMTKVLIGTPSSAGMIKVQVEGVDGRTSAYVKDGMTYVRTPYTLLSPAWAKSVQSADGMHVYALDNTPVLLLSDKGKMLRAYLSTMEQSDGQ
jgi:intracellular multiplication protein IcmK